jgi:hypothetical protein
MVPVALGAGEGGDFRAPRGIDVIGGVITSTLPLAHMRDPHRFGSLGIQRIAKTTCCSALSWNPRRTHDLLTSRAG